MSNIVLTGVIERVLPKTTGVSKNGTPWAKQEFVMIHSNERFERRVTFSVMGEEKLANFNIRQGEVLTAFLDMDAHEHEGKWYNSIICWRVERAHNVQYQTQPTQQMYMPNQCQIQQPMQGGWVQQNMPQQGYAQQNAQYHAQQNFPPQYNNGGAGYGNQQGGVPEDPNAPF